MVYPLRSRCTHPACKAANRAVPARRQHDEGEETDDDEDEIIYAQAFVLHAEEPVRGPVDGPIIRNRRRRRLLCFVLFPSLLFLLILGLAASKSRLENISAGEIVKQGTEIIRIRKIYHYFVPSVQVSSKESDAEATTSAIRLKNEVDALQNRVSTLEQTAFDSKSVSARQLAASVASELEQLRDWFAQLHQTVAKLEAMQNVGSAAVSKSTLTRLEESLASLQLVQHALRRDIEVLDTEMKKDRTAAVNDLIEAAIRKYDADKTGMADFALEPAGGSIVDTPCTETFDGYKTRVEYLFGIPLWSVTYSPRTVIQAGFSPGECWAFKGSQGTLIIRLSTLIHVTGVTYEHIPKAISPAGHIESAPDKFEVYALPSEKPEKGVLLGAFKYDDDGTALQYYPIPEHQSFPPTEYVLLKIVRNHGHPVYTCLYRFRVHGERVGKSYYKN